MEPEQDRMAYTNTTPMLPIEEWGAIVHPGRQDTPDCEHDWRIVFTIDEDRNGFYQARCTQCPTVAPPDVMNDYIDKLQAELAARDAKPCATCAYRCAFMGKRWQCVLPDGLASICAPNNFAEWQSKEEENG